jgi:hypothetical protein
MMEPPKSLGPPTVVLVQRTSDNPTGAPDHLTSSISVFFTLPKSVSPVTQTLQHIGGKRMRKQLQQLYFIIKYRKSSANSFEGIQYDLLETEVVPGFNSITNSTSLSRGNPGRSS